VNKIVLAINKNVVKDMNVILGHKTIRSISQKLSYRGD